MLASLKVKDHMNGTKITFTPEMDVLRAIHQLIEFKISGAPVIDQHGNLIGFSLKKTVCKWHLMQLIRANQQVKLKSICITRLRPLILRHQLLKSLKSF